MGIHDEINSLEVIEFMMCGNYYGISMGINSKSKSIFIISYPYVNIV